AGRAARLRDARLLTARDRWDRAPDAERPAATEQRPVSRIALPAQERRGAGRGSEAARRRSSRAPAPRAAPPDEPRAARPALSRDRDRDRPIPRAREQYLRDSRRALVPDPRGHRNGP